MESYFATIQLDDNIVHRGQVLDELSALNIDRKEYLRWDDTMDPETLIPIVLIDPSKTYINLGGFIADTAEKMAFADALEHGEFFFHQKYQAYIMDPITFTTVNALEFPAETDADQDFYFSRGFAKRIQLQDNLEDLKGIQLSDRVFL